MVNRFERFSYAISEISRCWHRIAGEVMGQYGLSGSSSVYFTTLYRYPEGITAAQLAEKPPNWAEEALIVTDDLITFTAHPGGEWSVLPWL